MPQSKNPFRALRLESERSDINMRSDINISIVAARSPGRHYVEHYCAERFLAHPLYLDAATYVWPTASISLARF